MRCKKRPCSTTRAATSTTTTSRPGSRRHVREPGAQLPPSHLQDSHYPGARKLGRGAGYEYPHDLPEGVSDQPLLPEALGDPKYYEPTDRGFETKLRERLTKLRQKRRNLGA